MTETNPWHPMRNTVDVKTLGKLAEECGELSSVVARCLIQGIYEVHPSTGKPNVTWLQEEIADVIGNIGLVVDRFNLDHEAIVARAEIKTEQLRQWHRMA